MRPLSPTLRIFPLPELVLFPEVLIPLHIFEPRYRTMLADALADDHLIGMVLARSSQDDKADGVFSTGCAGRIVRHEPLEDGRSLIVLRGTVRFRIRRELPVDLPYRVVEAQALYEAPVPAEHMRQWRGELRRRVDMYLGALATELDSLNAIFAKQELERIVNYLCAFLPLTVMERQSLLECSTAEQRYRRLCDVLAFKTAEAKLGLDALRRADS